MRTLSLLLLFNIPLVSFSQNDDPCGAINLPINTACNPILGNNIGATNTSGVPSPGCAIYSGQDVWYKITVPASGAVNLQMLPGTMINAGMATYTAPTCSGAFTLLQCNDNSGAGDMPLINHTGLIPGSTLYIRVWDYAGGTGSFYICAASTSTSSCGTPSINDYCASPITITQGAGFTSSLSGFTPDTPGNLTSGVFCGSIENNMWFQFTATATTHTFSFTNIGNCSGGAIQARVFSVSYTASGCCNSFTSVSNCIDQSTPGIVTATSLTIGNQYLLMIDGSTGAECNYTITDWFFSNPLPVELISFSGSSLSDGNLVQWTTESEIDNDYFILEHSRNGLGFNEIAKIYGAGTTMVSHQYEFLHQGVEIGTNYYKLTQVDIDGNRKSYQVFALQNESTKNGVYKIAPNPANESTTIYYQSNGSQDITIVWYNASGIEVSRNVYHVTDGMNLLFLPLEKFEKGIYLLMIEGHDETKTERVMIH